MPHVAASAIRIAHITHGLDVGGLEKVLVEIARNADRSRFHLQFISLGSRGSLADDVEALGWPVIALHQPSGLRPNIILRLAKIFRSQRIDVVHSHDNRPLVYAAPAARLAAVRRVIHTKHYGQLASVSPRQDRLTNLVARLVDDFVCVSRHGAELARNAGVPAARVRVIWNGIDLRRFAYRGPKADGSIVTVVRLSPEKGLDTLLRAAAQVVRQRPDLRFKIAGNGPCLQSLQQLVAELALGGQVEFLGEVRDVPRLLGEARLFVLPSLAEGVSLTLLEAMATGLPVVATRVGGNPEVVDEGRTGFLVPPNDPAALATAILALCNQADAAREIGRAGRLRVEEHFDVKKMTASYESLYLGERVPCTLS